jgi:hypothetical protein
MMFWTQVAEPRKNEMRLFATPYLSWPIHRAKEDAAGQFEWVFVSPTTSLNERSGKQITNYNDRPPNAEL